MVLLWLFCQFLAAPTMVSTWSQFIHDNALLQSVCALLVSLPVLLPEVMDTFKYRDPDDFGSVGHPEMMYCVPRSDLDRWLVSLIYLLTKRYKYQLPLIGLYTT
jgi:hypothetical protein